MKLLCASSSFERLRFALVTEKCLLSTRHYGMCSTARRQVLFPRTGVEVAEAVSAVLTRRSLETPSPLQAFLMCRRAGGRERASSSEAPRSLLVGVDCEGSRLGRFGRLSTLQLYAGAGSPFCFVDNLSAAAAIRGEALTGLLEGDEVLKVAHDCREDSAALYGQHKIKLDFVFDTQSQLSQPVCSSVPLAVPSMASPAGTVPYQASLGELLQRYLNLSEEDLELHARVKRRLEKDDALFLRRPLDQELLLYAAEGVRHLTRLAQAMSFFIDPEAVVSATRPLLQYRHINEHLDRNQIIQKHQKVQGMVAAINDNGIVVKLNCDVTGFIPKEEALDKFARVTLGDPVYEIAGDVIKVQVKNQSINGLHVLLGALEESEDRPSNSREDHNDLEGNDNAQHSLCML